MGRQYQPDRHSDAAFHGFEADSFDKGDWVFVRSSNVVEARMDWQANTLHVRFKDGSTYSYPCDHPTARGFAVAPSKGGFLHDWFISRGIKGSKG